MKTHNKPDGWGGHWYNYTPCDGHPSGSGCYKFQILEADLEEMHFAARHQPDSVRVLLDRIFQLGCMHDATCHLDGWLITRWILPPAVAALDAEYTPTPEEKLTMNAVDNIMDMLYRYDARGNIPPEQRKRLSSDDGLFMTFLDTYAGQHGYKMYPPDDDHNWSHLDLTAGRD